MKNFRPHCLVLTGRPQDRPNLTYIVSQITKNVSLMVYANVIKKPFGALPSDKDDTHWIREHKMKAFRAVTTGEKDCVFSPLSLTFFTVEDEEAEKLRRFRNFTFENFLETNSTTGKHCSGAFI